MGRQQLAEVNITDLFLDTSAAWTMEFFFDIQAGKCNGSCANIPSHLLIAFFICIFSSLFVNLIFFESSNYAARCIFSHLISPTSKRSEVLMKIFRYSHSTRVSFTASAAVPAESLIYVALRIRSVAPCGRQTDKRSIRKLARLCARQTNVQLYRKGI